MELGCTGKEKIVVICESLEVGRISVIFYMYLKITPVTWSMCFRSIVLVRS